MRVIENRALYFNIMCNILKAKQWNVTYYEKLFDPDHYQNHGVTVNDRLIRAKEQYDNTLRDIQDQRIYWNNGHKELYFSDLDISQALKAIIRENLREAYNWRDSNTLIAISRYRDVVMAKNKLNEINPDYKLVTAKYFIRHD